MNPITEISLGRAGFLLDNDAKIVQNFSMLPGRQYVPFHSTNDIITSFNNYGKIYRYESLNRFGEEIYYVKTPMNACRLFDILYIDEVFDF